MKKTESQAHEWETVIGMEVHAQVPSRAKLFSGASAQFGAEPNAHVSYIDAGMPGMLPVLNAACVDAAVTTGLGLNAAINRRSVFARKNYFYPDLPQGYQISQYDEPIVGKGEIVIDLEGGESRTIGITRLHLEQDAGKSLHDQHPTKSYVDLNRCGVALMEIVSEPDMRSAAEAVAYLSKLRSILRYLGTCDGNMEEGSMRADVNISVRRPGGPLGTRAEIKNVNSLKAVSQAIAYEVERQVAILESGGAVVQETRLWDPGAGVTRAMRGKEEAHDYRYFPDPDLLPLVLDEARIERLMAALPELPDAKKARFIAEYGLSPYDADVLVAERARADYFEAAAAAAGAPKKAANWVLNELLGVLNKDGKDIAQSPVSAEDLGALVKMIEGGEISGKIAKQVFEDMYKTGRAPADIVAEQGLAQVSDTGAIAALVDAVLTENPDNLAAYRAGKDKLFGFFVGQVMKKSRGQANPEAVNALLRERLDA
jgi:aspartyl-tRNA(Asn)/glutamyl-tRNA(Gln) amidotransferase subunit B